jgi:hypothetical protein
LIDRAFGPDPSSMAIDDALNSRQAYAGSFEFFSTV